MATSRCTSCGEHRLQPGFLRDTGQGARGDVRWVEGLLERGILGGAKLLGRPRWQVEADRCAACAHVELFAFERA